MKKRIAALIAIAGLMLIGAPAVAQASVQHPQRPALSYNYWQNVGYDGYIHYMSSSSDFVDAEVAETGLTPNYDCTDGWCLHSTTNGDCISWDNSRDVVVEDSCDSSKTSQLWYIVAIGSSNVWENEWEIENATCTGKAYPVMGVTAESVPLTMLCTNPANGDPYNNDLWNNLGS